MNKLQVGYFVYKYLNGLLPLSFTDNYTRKSTIHMINIRNCHYLYLPRHRTNIRGNSQIQGVKVWNVNPIRIRNKININSLKSIQSVSASNVSLIQ